MIEIMETGALLSEYLEQNEITIDQLAKASNVSPRTIYRIINGEAKFTYDVALGVNKLLPEIAIDFFMKYDDAYQVQGR